MRTAGCSGVYKVQRLRPACLLAYRAASAWQMPSFQGVAAGVSKGCQGGYRLHTVAVVAVNAAYRAQQQLLRFRVQAVDDGQPGAFRQGALAPAFNPGQAVGAGGIELCLPRSHRPQELCLRRVIRDRQIPAQAVPEPVQAVGMAGHPQIPGRVEQHGPGGRCQFTDIHPLDQLPAAQPHQLQLGADPDIALAVGGHGQDALVQVRVGMALPLALLEPVQAVGTAGQQCIALAEQQPDMAMAQARQ